LGGEDVNKKRVMTGLIAVSLSTSALGSVGTGLFSESVAYAATADDVRDLRFTRLTDTRVDFDWRGTSGDILVEIKRSSDEHPEYSTRTSSRSISCSVLDSNTEYKIFFDSHPIATFRTRDDRYDSYYDPYYYNNYDNEDGYYYNGRWYYYNDPYARDLVINSKTDTTVAISWRGTSRNVYVELKKSNSSYTTGKWANRSVDFDNLSSDTEYSIYIDGRYMSSFRTEKTNKASNVSIQKYPANHSVDITWGGTSGSVEVMIKRGDNQVSSKSTSEKKATFYNLDYNQDYSLYIDGKYMQTFSLPYYFATQMPSSNWQPPQSTYYPSAPSYNYSPTVFFSDIQGHWAQSAIERLTSFSVIQGFSNNTFKPEKQVSREEFIKMLVIAMKYPTDNSPTGFTDIAVTRWSAPYIAAAVRNEVIYPGEYSGKRFVGSKFMTREEAAVMIARALKLSPSTDSLLFTDNDLIKNQGLVGAAVKAGVITGLPDNRFNPNGFLSRAAAAVMINEIFTTY
jgi:hypothetical protein